MSDLVERLQDCCDGEPIQELPRSFLCDLRDEIERLRDQDAVLAGEIMKQRALIYGVIFGLGAWAGIVAFIFCLVEFFA